MREIKFRVVDTTSKKVYRTKSEILGFEKLEKEEQYSVLWNDDITNFVPYFSNLIYQQYTWLKDKNWVEIWEWDIIAQPWEFIQYLEREWRAWERKIWKFINEREVIEKLYRTFPAERVIIWDKVYWPVVWDDKTWYQPFCDSEDNCCWGGSRSTNFIVIWNIYENPELLTSS